MKKTTSTTNAKGRTEHEEAVRKAAQREGFKGSAGWIYHPEGHMVCQGWATFAILFKVERGNICPRVRVTDRGEAWAVDERFAARLAIPSLGDARRGDLLATGASYAAAYDRAATALALRDDAVKAPPSKPVVDAATAARDRRVLDALQDGREPTVDDLMLCSREVHKQANARAAELRARVQDLTAEEAQLEAALDVVSELDITAGSKDVVQEVRIAKASLARALAAIRAEQIAAEARAPKT